MPRTLATGSLSGVVAVPLKKYSFALALVAHKRVVKAGGCSEGNLPAA